MIAYFTMEIALEPGMPTYSGGLGILAGDTVRSAADLGLPMAAVTLLHRKGYFYQRLDSDGQQVESPAHWVVGDYLREVASARAGVSVDGRAVALRCWRYDVTGVGGGRVPVFFLDADLPENAEPDRHLTDVLYGGDQAYRLGQEIILGIGGMRMLWALGYGRAELYHMNEGHSALLGLALLEEEAARAGRAAFTLGDVEAVRARCVFTTHTPVPEGQDQYAPALAGRVLGRPDVCADGRSLACVDGRFNMTYLALNLSGYHNGVAKKHAEVSRLMFAPYAIDSITNGVHAATWVCPEFQALFDRFIPDWRRDNFALRYALSLPRPAVWEAHTGAKRRLIQYVNRETNAGMDVDVLTLGFARRATTYKRADLLFADLDRLRGIARQAGAVQVVLGGKAHPADLGGKEMIRRVCRARDLLQPDVSVAYMENYDAELAKLMTAGVDVWLNTPQPPMEASGTSGMKAALNGVPSLSILDGWWIEGHINGVTGWSIESDGVTSQAGDAAALYDKLERVVVPAFYGDRERFLGTMLHCIALNGSFFNTQRMLQQYVVNAYFRSHTDIAPVQFPTAVSGSPATFPAPIPP